MTHHSAGIILANSDAEAEGLGLQRARQLKPEEDGWVGHAVTVKELGKESLLQLAKDARPKAEIQA